MGGMGGVYEVYRLENLEDVVNLQLKALGFQVSKTCNYGVAGSVHSLTVIPIHH